MTFYSVVCLCDTRPTVTHSPQRANQFRRRIVFVNHKAGYPHCFSTYVYKGQIHLAEKSSLDLPFRKQASQDSHHHHRRNQGCTYFTTAKRLSLRLALMMGSALSTQFSNFAHDCQGTDFNGDSTTVIGVNCHSESSNNPHTSWLNLDLCLSYESPNLVAHQGYIFQQAHETRTKSMLTLFMSVAVTSRPRSAQAATAPSTTTAVTVMAPTSGPGPVLT